MTKFLYFIKWLFNWNKWYPFQKRFTIYTLAGFAIAFVLGNANLLFLPAVFIWIDIMFTSLKEKWDNFNQEQDQMLKDIASKDQ